MAGKGAAGAGQSEKDGKTYDRRPQKDRNPDMEVNFVILFGPCPGRDPNSCHNTCNPFKNHQAGKEAVDALKGVELICVEKGFSSLSNLFQDTPAFFYRPHNPRI